MGDGVDHGLSDLRVFEVERSGSRFVEQAVHCDELGSMEQTSRESSARGQAAD